ncbi:MAG: cyclic nucleotide-binding domain-containing protein [Methylococcales bacterium]|nr:cyclic nucleotide-binding domain-containing protein [Methylococcales bacterium]
MTALKLHLISLECNPETVANLLDQTAWAKDFSWPQLQAMGRYFKPYGIAAGDCLFNEGDPAGTMGILVKGEIAIYKQGQVIAKLGPGRTYGEMSLLDNAPRSAQAVACQDSQLLIIDKTTFRKMAQDNTKLAFMVLWKIAFFLSQNLRNTSGLLMDVLDEKR